MPTAHSDIVGGSTAKRVINCPGSVALVRELPKPASSKFADEGTLLHDAIADVLDKGIAPESVIGRTYQGVVLTPELYDDKFLPALDMLDELDPDQQMDIAVESEVGFGDFLPGVFGSCDVLGRIGDVAYVIDWKFGHGIVSATENAQMLFYAAAAMRTPETAWVFEGATSIVMSICQPAQGKPSVWETTPARVKQFEQELATAVKKAMRRNAPLNAGEWCTWCAAKPTCPLVTGQIDRVQNALIQNLDAEQIGEWLTKVEMVEQWAADLKKLAYQMLEEGVRVPGWKLVAGKLSNRKWVEDETAVHKALVAKLLSDTTPPSGAELVHELTTPPKLVSPTQAEKVLKKAKIELPEELLAPRTSSTAMVPESDPRPAQTMLSQAHRLRQGLALLQR